MFSSPSVTNSSSSPVSSSWPVSSMVAIEDGEYPSSAKYSGSVNGSLSFNFSCMAFNAAKVVGIAPSSFVLRTVDHAFNSGTVYSSSCLVMSMTARYRSRRLLYYLSTNLMMPCLFPFLIAASLSFLRTNLIIQYNLSDLEECPAGQPCFLQRDRKKPCMQQHPLPFLLSLDESLACFFPSKVALATRVLPAGRPALVGMILLGATVLPRLVMSVRLVVAAAFFRRATFAFNCP
jgi:hypothetical protein